MHDNKADDSAKRLRSLFERPAYISHRQAAEAAEACRQALPSGLAGWARAALVPARLVRHAKNRSLVRSFESKRKKHNKEFVVAEIKRCERLFDDIDSYPLDSQQRRAVVTDEDNNLVIAGAGSGKTLTIVGKVHYLIKVLGVSPHDILPISFTNKSAASLKERIGIEDVNPQTFHAFGLQVLRSVERRQPKLLDEGQLDPLIKGFIAQLLKRQDGRYRQALSNFCKQYDTPAKDFTSLVRTFLALLKSDGKTVKEVLAANRESPSSEAAKQRTEQFLQLFAPLYVLYDRYLKDNGLIDFHDMVNRAADYIGHGDYRHGLRYVIVDEFQDLSFGRYRILEAIRAQAPEVKFYCVGDDWQSIYRFAGSDMALFRDFEKYFGHTAISRIETTYRFNQPMIGLSTSFILQNPNQTAKQLRAPDGRPATTFSIVRSEDRNDDTAALLKALSELEASHGLTAKSEVYVIGRYNFDINRLHDVDGLLSIDTTTGLIRYKKRLDVHFITAHRAKGLEAEFAILINCNRGKFGFPSEQADDPVLNILLSSADQFKHGEERRLFYVAMTRAKLHTTFVTYADRASPFMTEIQRVLTAKSSEE